jgi:hypothetical protein
MDSSADLSAQILNNPEISQKLLAAPRAHHLQEIDGGGINDVGKLWAVIFRRLPSG